MPRTVVGYLPGGYLNNGASASRFGSTDTESGLPIATGIDTGQFQEFSDGNASRYSYAPTGTLYAGTFMWVQLDPALTGNVPLGKALFWLQTADNASATGGAIVTTTASANAPDFAGVSIDSNFGAALPYAWIQQNGKVSVQFDPTLTNGAPAYGDVIGLKSTYNGNFDDLESDTAGTAENPANVLGIALAAPVANTRGLVRINRAISRF